MKPGSHGSTFGGNPLAMSVGNAVLDIILKKGFLKRVQNNGLFFKRELEELKNQYPKVIDEVRGKGLLLGIRLRTNQLKFIKKLLDNNLLVVKAADNVVRLLPPLNVKRDEIEQTLSILKKVCKGFS